MTDSYAKFNSKIKKLYLYILIFVFTQNCFGQINTLKDYKDFTIKIGKERFKAYKGLIYVKEKYSDTSSNLIYLPVIIIKSLSSTPEEPIFWCEGGPGVSNLNFHPPKCLLEKHDVVLIGYRGIDGKTELNSKEIGKAIKGLHNQLLSDKSLDNIEKEIKKYIIELSEKNIDLTNYTIIDVIDDLENVRKALGYNKINLLSVSYGTRVALLYGYRYPNAIHRSIMIGVNPPGHFIWYPEKTSQIIKLYDSLYQNSTLSNVSIEQDINNALKNIPKRWSLFKLDRDKIRTGAFLLLYSKGNAVTAFDAFHKAATEKDYSGLYLMQLLYDVMVPKSFVWGDMFNKAASADLNNNIDYRKLFRGDTVSIGAPFSLLLFGCSKAWPSFTIDEKFRKIDTSFIETLMISGNLDISTPSDFTTKELLPFLPNGRQIILKDMAHADDLMHRQRPSFENLITTYFDKGVVDTSAYKYDAIDFKPSKDFCHIAKVYYPIIAIISLFK